jgi:oligopeptide transport system substrate-binding protein
MTYQAMVCAPKHRAEKDPEHWADTVEGFVSSGPFKLVKWEHNQRLEWEINPYYNGPHKPGIQKVVQLMGTPQTNWFNVWLNKEIDIMAILQPAELARVRSDPKLNPLLHWWTDPQTEFIIMDTHNPPFNNQKLRLALAKAIDREALCTRVMLGTTIPAQTMLPPDFPAYNPELESVQAYDVEKAKALLAEAGYPDGKDASGKQLELTFTSNGRDPKVEFVKEQWETNLGIKVNIEVLENAVWREKRSKREMKLFKSGYEYDYMDPANLLTQLWRSIDDIGSRQHLWKNDKFDELVTKAGTETDLQKRIQLFQEAERILVEDVGGIFLTHILIFQVWWPYITGIKPNRKGEVAYRYLDISRFQMYIRNDVDQWRKPH